MKTETKSELFRELPSVDELLHAPDIVSLIAEHGSTAVTGAVRSVLSRLREQISSGLLSRDSLHLALGGLRAAIDAQLRDALAYSLRQVINATGVILHTNLGRAPLAEQALAHAREAATSYSNLEFDIEAGERGKRDIHVDRLFRKLLSAVGSTTDHVETAASAVPRRRSQADPYLRPVSVARKSDAIPHTCRIAHQHGKLITFGLQCSRCNYGPPGASDCSRFRAVDHASRLRLLEATPCTACPLTVIVSAA
jgi:hypothetical protein